MKKQIKTREETKITERVNYLLTINKNRFIPRIYTSNDHCIDSEGNIVRVELDYRFSPRTIKVPMPKKSKKYPLKFSSLELISYSEANLILGKDSEKPNIIMGEYRCRSSINEWELQAMMDAIKMGDHGIAGYSFGTELESEYEIIIPTICFRRVIPTGHNISFGKYDLEKALKYAREDIKINLEIIEKTNFF